MEKLDPKIIVGKIVKLGPHPNADKLQIVRVDIGQKEPLNIICGAGNIKEGQIIPVVLPGGMVKTPGGGEFLVGEVAIRGIKSTGMLCSPLELGISDNHEEILILPAKTAEYLGRPLREVGFLKPKKYSNDSNH
ncbi:MAG: hypothetical protein ABH867_01500 [Patescibacteria group bacterium]|nr:hypothetical protein [Patescibacteria group bacterium]